MRWLLLAYLATIPFTKLLYLGGLGYSFQLPELIFLVLAGGVALRPDLRRAVLTYRPDRLDLSVALLLLGQAVAAAANGDLLWNHEVLALVYLGALYFLGGRIVARGVGQDFIYHCTLALTATLVLTVAFSLLYQPSPTGWLAELVETKYFPGIGWLPRVEALTMSPNMLMNVSLLPLTLLGARAAAGRANRWTVLGIALLLGCCLLTLSKSLPLLAVAAILVVLYTRRSSRRLRALGWVAVFAIVVVTVVTPKFVVIRDGQPDRETILQQGYATPTVFARTADYTVYESMHLRLSRESLAAFRSAPLFGIGPGKFVDRIEDLKAAGRYPLDRLSYGPHSLYLGLLATSGLCGLATLLFFLVRVYYRWRGRLALTGPHWVTVGLGVYLLLWAVDGINMDTLHFRQFWWILAILAGREADSPPPPTPSQPLLPA